MKFTKVSGNVNTFNRGLIMPAVMELKKKVVISRISLMYGCRKPKDP